MIRTILLLAAASALAPAPAARSASYVTVAFSPDGKHLVTTGVTLPVKVWQLPGGKEARELAERTAWGSRATYLPDGRVLLFGDKDGKVRAFSADGTAGEALVAYHETTPWANVSRDGKRLALPDEHGIEVRELGAAKALHALAAPHMVWSCDFSPDGKRLAAVVYDRTLRVWDLETGREALKVETREPCYSMAWSPDGKTIACGHDCGILTFWNAADGKHLYTLSHPGSVMGLAYSADGKKLASVSFDETTRIWDAAAGRELHRMAGGRSTVAFSPDGKMLAAGGDGDKRMAWVWDAETGKELLKLMVR